VVQGELVAEGGNGDVGGGAAIGVGRALGGIDFGGVIDVGIGGKQRVALVLDVVDQPTIGAVEPDVSHHAVRGGMGPGRQGGVSDDGFGVGVRVMGIGKHDALIE
jgi:hypothetical protein